MSPLPEVCVLSLNFLLMEDIPFLDCNRFNSYLFSVSLKQRFMDDSDAVFSGSLVFDDHASIQSEKAQYFGNYLCLLYREDIPFLDYNSFNFYLCSSVSLKQRFLKGILDLLMII